jgi:DNA/RNA endonuclease YhcR with UshA esterase domain
LTSEHVISAIIGFWRMGATLTEMSDETSIPVSVIIKIISRHETPGEYIKREDRIYWQQTMG